MKTITVNVSEVVYQLFQNFGRRRGRKTSELIREAMEKYAREHIEGQNSISALSPLELGACLTKDLEMDELLEEMTSGSERN